MPGKQGADAVCGGAGLDERGLAKRVPTVAGRPQRRARTGADIQHAARREIGQGGGRSFKARPHGGIGRRQPRGQIGLDGKLVVQVQPAVARFGAVPRGQDRGCPAQIRKRDTFQGTIDGGAQRGGQFHGSEAARRDAGRARAQPAPDSGDKASRDLGRCGKLAKSVSHVVGLAMAARTLQGPQGVLPLFSFLLAKRLSLSDNSLSLGSTWALFKPRMAQGSSSGPSFIAGYFCAKL